MGWDGEIEGTMARLLGLHCSNVGLDHNFRYREVTIFIGYFYYLLPCTVRIMLVMINDISIFKDTSSRSGS